MSVNKQVKKVLTPGYALDFERDYTNRGNKKGKRKKKPIPDVDNPVIFNDYSERTQKEIQELTARWHQKKHLVANE